MGFFIWGLTAGAAGAAAAAAHGFANITMAAIGIAVALATLAGACIWRIARVDRERDRPKETDA